MHLVIDGRGEVKAWEVCRFLEECPDLIGMTVIDGPVVHKNGKRMDAITIIAESHIAVHTRGGEVSVDIFSCKDFDASVVESYVAKYFGLEGIRSEVFERVMAPVVVGVFRSNLYSGRRLK